MTVHEELLSGAVSRLGGTDPELSATWADDGMDAVGARHRTLAGRHVGWIARTAASRSQEVRQCPR